MKRICSVLLLIGVVTGVISGCAATPEASAPAVTQTPWIVVVTETPGSGAVAKVQPTQTARVVVVTATLGPPEPAEPARTPETVAATPTSAKKPTKAPTERATRSPTATISTTAPTETLATVTVAATEAPTATPQAPTNPPPQPTNTLPAPMSTARSGGHVYPPPELWEPTDEAQVRRGWTVVFEWEPVGELAADEYYRLDIERPRVPYLWEAYGDWALTKDPSFTWAGSAKDPFHPPEGSGTAPGQWWVTVVRQVGEDEDGRPLVEAISAPSEKRTLFLEPKPPGS